MYNRPICIQLYYCFLLSVFYTNYKKVYTRISFTKVKKIISGWIFIILVNNVLNMMKTVSNTVLKTSIKPIFKNFNIG